MPHPVQPLPRRRQVLSLGIALAGSLLALPGCASEPSRHAGLARLEIVDRDSGRVLPVYHHHGRRFVAGRPGARYALRLRNHSAGRVLVVLSVDGVNVVSGQTAAWSQTGYVLDPGRSCDITGWRKSDTQVAAFEFAPLEQSYAARTGRPDDVGVIGMAVFRERPPPPPPPPVVSMAPRAERQAPGAAAPSRDAARESATADKLASGRLGTGHGEREQSVVSRTAFERAASTPDQLTQIVYDSHERLVALGVIPATLELPRPRPFPAQATGYVPDPPRW